MPKPNVEVVREAVRANRSGDPETTTEVAISLCDAAVEFTSRVAAVEGGTYRGHAGIRRYFEDMADAWREWRNEMEQITELSPDSVLAEIRFRGVGKESGMALELRSAFVCVLAAGKLVRVQSYATREEALKAEGISQGEP